MLLSVRTRRVAVCVMVIVAGTVAAGDALAQAAASHPTNPTTKRKAAPHTTTHTTTHTTSPATTRAATHAPVHATPIVPPAATGVIVPPTPAAGALASSAEMVLRDAPEGRAMATITAGSPMTPVARDRGWVRVDVVGWVKDDGLAPATATVGALSAADLRADPQKARGAVVRWEVQVLALARADVLHKDLTEGEPYLLARGPGNENAMLYIAIPPALLPQATALTALAPLTATIVATVRNGKSAPLGVPILDAQSLARRP
jgi:hypothetical protein